MELEPTQLVLGRGEVYFEPFAPGTRVGTGERYVGNTTSFQVSRDVNRVNRATSFKGQKTAKESPVVSENIAIQFITDHVSVENVGLFYGQEGGTVAVPAASQITETFIVKRGNFYQLGKTLYPNGVREALDVSVRLAGIIVPEDENYSLDLELGRLQILKGGTTIPNGATISVTFSLRTFFSETVISKARDVYGAIRFISRNVAGQRRNAFFPFVRISPRGAVDLKGDQWQQIPFDATVMRLGPFVDLAYIDTVVGTGATLDEQSIIDQGGISVGEFPYWEDQLDHIINISMPASDYGQAVP